MDESSREFTRVHESLREFTRVYESSREFTRVYESLREFTRDYERLREIEKKFWALDGRRVVAGNGRQGRLRQWRLVRARPREPGRCRWTVYRWLGTGGRVCVCRRGRRLTRPCRRVSATPNALSAGAVGDAVAVELLKAVAAAGGPVSLEAFTRC